MTKDPSVSVREIQQELRNGVGTRLTTEERLRVSRIIEGLERAVRNRKLEAPKKIRTTKTKAQLYTLEEWERLWCGALSVALIDTWATRQNLCKRQLSQLIEEFRTEMISKAKQYADFKAAFQVYLTKGYLSKRIDQVRLRPGEGTSKWGNSTSTRGLSL